MQPVLLQISFTPFWHTSASRLAPSLVRMLKTKEKTLKDNEVEKIMVAMFMFEVC
jgi:hypothetical protein